MLHQDDLPDETAPLLQSRSPQHDRDQADLKQLTTSAVVSRSDLIWILAGLWGPVFLGALDSTIVATLLSPIGSYFHKSNQASYLGTSYLLSVAACTPLYGRLSDILGRKGAMLLGLSLFGKTFQPYMKISAAVVLIATVHTALGTLLCAVAPSMGFLIAARAVAGMGGGGVMTASSIAVTDLVPLKQRGVYQGMANVVFGLGAGLGGPMGGWINDTLGWRFAFSVQLPLMALSFVIIIWKVNILLPEAIRTMALRDRIRRIDYLGALTLVVAISCLLLPVSLKNTEDLPWSHPVVWGLLVASVVAAAAFGFTEVKLSGYPILPLRLISQRTPMAVAFTNFFVSLVSFSMLYNVPLYFSAVRLTSATQSGLHLLPNSIALSLGSLFAGWMIRRTGKYWLLIVISATVATAASLLVTLWNDSTGSFELWFDIVPNGFGFCGVLTGTLIAMVASVTREDMAVATGITYLFRTVAQVLGVSLSGAVVQGVLLKELRARVKGEGSEKLIELIRHSTESIKDLPPDVQNIAVACYKTALKIVFICQTAVGVLSVLSSLPIQEFSLPDTISQSVNRESADSSD